MISIEKYKNEMASELWQVYFTSVRMICSQDYTDEQITAWAPREFELERFREKLEQLNPFIAKIDSKIIGYADLQSDGLIDHFFVHGEYQSKGVGASLMDAILEEGINMPKLYSHVSMTAKPFFLSHGFVVEKEQEVKIRGCRLKNNVMVRNRVSL